MQPQRGSKWEKWNQTTFHWFPLISIDNSCNEWENECLSDFDELHSQPNLSRNGFRLPLDVFMFIRCYSFAATFYTRKRLWMPIFCSSARSLPYTSITSPVPWLAFKNYPIRNILSTRLGAPTACSDSNRRRRKGAVGEMLSEKHVWVLVMWLASGFHHVVVAADMCVCVCTDSIDSFYDKISAQWKINTELYRSIFHSCTYTDPMAVHTWRRWKAAKNRKSVQKMSLRKSIQPIQWAHVSDIDVEYAVEIGKILENQNYFLISGEFSK